MEQAETPREALFTRTAIYRAIRRYDLQGLIRSIRRRHRIKSDVDVLQYRDQHTQFTYLHLVVVVANLESESSLLPQLYALSNAGVDVDAVDCRRRTALQLAVVKRLISFVAALLRAGADPTIFDYRTLIANQPEPYRRRLSETFDKFSPGLWKAVTSKDLGTVYILVNSWCRVNISRCNRQNQTGSDVVNGVGDVAELEENMDEQRVTLIQWAKSIGANRDLIRLLEGYELTLELVHATLAGDRDRMLELLMDTRTCDVEIMDISHQDDDDDDGYVPTAVGNYSYGNVRHESRLPSTPLRPRSLRETAESMGHLHVLDLLPEDSLDSYRRRRKQDSVIAPDRPEKKTFTTPSLRLDLPHATDGRDENDSKVYESEGVATVDEFISGSEQRSHSLRGRNRSLDRSDDSSHFKESYATPLDTIATPRGQKMDKIDSDAPTRIAPVAPPRRVAPVYSRIDDNAHNGSINGVRDIDRARIEQEELVMNSTLETPRSVYNETPRTSAGESYRMSSAYDDTAGVKDSRRSSSKKSKKKPKSNRSTLCLIS